MQTENKMSSVSIRYVNNRRLFATHLAYFAATAEYSESKKEERKNS